MKLPTVLITVLDDELNEVQRHVIFLEREGKLLCCDTDAVDYYGEYRGWVPWIHPKLEAWAEKNGGYGEWENAEAICFAK